MKTLLKNGILNQKSLNIFINNDRIEYIGGESPKADNLIDISGLIVMPGLIDPHVHVRDLGQSEKEDWTSASEAALRGGITTIFDMPNNQPPTTNLKNLNLKREKAKFSKVNYRFNIALTATNYEEVKEILETGAKDVSALKLFLAGSSANEYIGDKELIESFFRLSEKFDIPIITHSERQECIDKFAALYPNPTIFDHNPIRNRECSIEGTKFLIDIAKQTGGILYVAHTSTGEEIDLIEENKNSCRVYCEVTPHHLLLSEEILQEVGNFGKVNPPIRTKVDNARLWEGIKSGIVDVLGTDHAPHQRAEKLQDYSLAPSGFPGLETLLPLMLNEVNRGVLSMEDLVKISSRRASEIFKQEKRGEVKVGNFADLTIVDLDKEWTINAQEFMTKAKYSPFEGRQGKGGVEMVFVNGKQYKI